MRPRANKKRKADNTFYTSPIRYTRIGVHDIPNWINWLGPVPHIALDPTFGSFTLLKSIGFTLGHWSLW
jgi:hypothetical protein